MPRLYWTSEASGQLAALDGESQRALVRRVSILADFPYAGVELHDAWRGFRKLLGTPIPWIIIYTVRDPETVIITYLRHAHSRWEAK
jgi:plasmid stabilization system protein ParE